MAELTGITGSQRKALDLTGVSRSTWHYRHKPRPRVAEPVPQKARAYPSRIPAEDRAQIAACITAGWALGASIDYAFAVAWDEGVMLASRRSWWRIGADIQDQTARPLVPTRASRAASAPRAAPVLTATGPNQVWSWDITDIRSPYKGCSYKAYSIIDIYSRKLVGWRIEERELDDFAVEMFQTAIDTHGKPAAVHADSGSAMRSNKMKTFLSTNHITETHNRPRVSNDNPYSEAEFKTMKYRPNYPGWFTDIESAREFFETYVTWYNTQHRHSGIALFTPDSVHNGTWTKHWTIRDHANQAYYTAHPERFHHPPRTPKPASTVGINIPKPDKNPTERLTTG